MARVSSSGIAIFAMIMIESVVTGEKLSLRSNSEPSPNSVLLDNKASASITQTEGPVTSVVVEQNVDFGIGHGTGAPNFGFGAEVNGALGDKQLAAALGARKGPRLPLADADLAATSPGLRSASADSSVPVVTMAATVTQSFSTHEGAVSRFQLVRAQIAQARTDINRAVRAASTLQTGAAVGVFRSLKKAELALTVCVICGMLVMFTWAGWWLGSACIGLLQKKKKSRKPLAASNDPLAYAFAARRLEVQQAASVGSWLPWSIRM